MRSTRNHHPWMAWLSAGVGLVLLLSAMPLDCHAQIKRGSRFSSKGGCLDCHDWKTLDDSVRHEPFAKKECRSCHKPHGLVGMLRLKDTGAALCMICHDRESLGLEKSRVHEPARTGKCLSCHDPHAAPKKNLLADTVEKVCRSCHGGAEFTGEVRHQPLEAGCFSCHDVHGSDNEHLLKMPAAELCVSCHDLSQEPMQKAHQGYPIGGDSCMKCHSPHTSQEKGLLTRSFHVAVADDCGSCHTAPTDENPFALNETDPSELCLSCHDADEVAPEGVHMPVADGECLECHQPHGSRQPVLLREEPEKLCLQCHGDIEEDLVRSSRHAPAREDCTNCHVAHGQQSKILLTTMPPRSILPSKTASAPIATYPMDRISPP